MRVGDVLQGVFPGSASLWIRVVGDDPCIVRALGGFRIGWSGVSQGESLGGFWTGV